MDFLDFLSMSAGEGGRRTRLFGAAIGGLLCGAVGAIFGHLYTASLFSTVSFGVIGALIGAGLGALFAFAIVVGLIIAAIAAAALLLQTSLGTT